MTPGEIDAYVRRRSRRARICTRCTPTRWPRLDPDLILTQDLCRVCALPAGQVADALDYLGCQADVRVARSAHPRRSLELDHRGRSTAPGSPDARPGWSPALRARLDAVAHAVAGRPRPRVAVVEWVDPPFSAGHWVPDLITAAGGEPVAAPPGARSVETTWAELVAARPDVVLVAPCGFHLDGASSRPRRSLRSFPAVPVWAIDADGLVVRPGPRLVDGVEAIASALHRGVRPPHPAIRRIR